MAHYPTIEQLRTLPGVDLQTAALLLAVLRGDVQPAEQDYADLFPKTSAWVRGCYNPPRSGDVKAHAVAELLGTDVQALEVKEAPYESYQGHRVGVYANAGDPWTATLVRCTRDDVEGWEPGWVVGCWGDLLEAAERVYCAEATDPYATLPRNDNPDAYAAE